MLKVYGFPTYNLTKVLMTAEELNLKYEYIALDPAKGETKTPEHFKRHPLGKIPVIEMDGQTLFESTAICRHLAHSQKSPLYPEANWGRAIVDQWMDFMAQHAGRWLAAVFYQEFIKGVRQKLPVNQAEIDEAKGFLKVQLPVLEKQLSGNPYLTGRDFTLADLIAFAYATTHEKSSMTLDEYPRLKNWYAEIKKRPSYAKAIAHYA